MTNIIDVNEFLSRKRRDAQSLDGVYHSQKYVATCFKGDDYTVDGAVLIEIYAGREPGFCIDFGDDARLITLTRAEAVQLAKDIWASVE